MALTWDEAKRARTLVERRLDFADAGIVFAGPTLTLPDARQDYGEMRQQTYGLLHERLVMLVWTERATDRHIISMRKCNDREYARFLDRLG